MTSFINSLRSAAQKRANYRQIVAEIEGLSEREATDLNIARSDAHAIAQAAVYGR